MKEAADRTGKGFIGGFIDDNGDIFVMTNIEDPETKKPPTDKQLRYFLRSISTDTK